MNQQSEIPKIGIDVLTSREKQVAYYLTMGYCRKQVAAKLFISVHTVRNTIVRIMAKVDASSTVDIARKVILSVENPKQVFLGWICLIAFGMSTLYNNPIDMRRTVSKRVRTHKTIRNGKA